MLYKLYETQRALLSPFAEFASATAKLYSHPLSPFAQGPAAQRISAGFELVHRLSKEYEKQEFNITSVNVDGVEVAVQERVALAKPFCHLLRFKRFSDEVEQLTAMKQQPSVLVVAPLSGHHATLLRDTVRTLLRDHKVYVTDWVDARMVPLEAGPFGLDDYVHYVQEFIRHIGPDVHVISVCQPTVPVLAAISLMATAGEKTPATMIMMGGPIDARKSPTAVNNLALNKTYDWFESNVIHTVPTNYPGKGRRVYPGFLQHTGFVAMNPERHARSHYDYFRDLIRGDDGSAESHRAFYDEYNAVLDMPAEYYLDTIKTVFQDFALVNGTWEVDGQLVRPQDIKTTALLTIEGELDDISGAGQTKAAHDLCTGIAASKQSHYDVVGAGHYGIFAGRRWRDLVYPEVRKFIAKYNPSTPGADSEPVLIPSDATLVLQVGKAPAKVARPSVSKAPSKTVARKAAKAETISDAVATSAAARKNAAPAARTEIALKSKARPKPVRQPGKSVSK